MWVKDTISVFTPYSKDEYIYLLDKLLSINNGILLVY